MHFQSRNLVIGERWIPGFQNWICGWDCNPYWGHCGWIKANAKLWTNLRPRSQFCLPGQFGIEALVPLTNKGNYNIAHELAGLRYDTRCYFNVRSKPTWVSLIYRTEPTIKKCKNRRTKSRKQICSEMTVNSPGNTIRYDTRYYFNVRSKADISQLNLPHGTDN